MTLAQVDILLTARAAANQPPKESAYRPVSMSQWANAVVDRG